MCKVVCFFLVLAVFACRKQEWVGRETTVMVGVPVSDSVCLDHDDYLVVELVFKDKLEVRTMDYGSFYSRPIDFGLMLVGSNRAESLRLESSGVPQGYVYGEWSKSLRVRELRKGCYTMRYHLVVCDTEILKRFDVLVRLNKNPK